MRDGQLDDAQVRAQVAAGVLHRLVSRNSRISAHKSRQLLALQALEVVRAVDALQEPGCLRDAARLQQRGRFGVVGHDEESGRAGPRTAYGRGTLGTQPWA